MSSEYRKMTAFAITIPSVLAADGKGVDETEVDENLPKEKKDKKALIADLERGYIKT